MWLYVQFCPGPPVLKMYELRGLWLLWLTMPAQFNSLTVKFAKLEDEIHRADIFIQCGPTQSCQTITKTRTTQAEFIDRLDCEWQISRVKVNHTSITHPQCDLAGDYAVQPL